MGGKTKKKTPTSPAADSPAAADAEADAPAGTLLLQVCEPPPECKALSVCLHWEEMRRANLVLGGAVHVTAASDGSEEGRAPAPTLLLSAWSSGRVPAGRAGLPSTVRAAYYSNYMIPQITVTLTDVSWNFRELKFAII